MAVAAAAMCEPAYAAPDSAGGVPRSIFAAPHSAGAVAVRAVPSGESADGGRAVAMARADDAAFCEMCVREDGRAHCAALSGEGIRHATPHPGPSAVHAGGGSDHLVERSGSACARAGTDQRPRPPDLHLLQLLRV